MGATVFEIAGVRATPLVKGVGTKSLGKGRVTNKHHKNVTKYVGYC